MSLRRKIAVLIALVVALYSLSQYAVQQIVIKPSYFALEQQEAGKNMTRCIQAIRHEQDNLQATCSDWAIWDDTSNFMLGQQRQEYIDLNMAQSTMANIHVNATYFYDTSARLSYGHLWNIAHPPTEQDQKAAAEFFAHPPAQLMTPKYPGEHCTGILKTPCGLMLVSAQPIIDTQHKKPSAGILIMGRLLDDAAIAKFSRQTQAMLHVWSAAGGQIPPHLRPLLEQTGTENFEFQYPNENNCHVYAALRDVRNQPAMLLMAEFPRAITAKGRQASNFAMVSTLAIAGGLLLLVLVMMQRGIIKPLCRLTDYIAELRRTRDLSRRIELNRHDEMGTLADGFNDLCHALASTQKVLLEARDAAEHANQAKSSFLAKMSHEIRTPLNGILGLTRLATETTDPSEQRQYLEIVNSSADTLLQIVNDILDLSKLQAGHMELEQTSFSLRKCIGDCVRLLQGRAVSKGIEMTCSISPDIPEGIIGDPYRLRQIIVNLLGNALKFTDRGEIALSAKLLDSNSQTATVQIAVRDTGIGIASDKLGIIFNAFEQADNSTTRNYGGTGLGLTIAAEMTEKMHGRIWAESEIGKGSCFFLNIPLAIDANYLEPVHPAASPASLPASSKRKLNILLAEDNTVNQLLAVKLVQKWGHRIEVVDSGDLAVEKIRQYSYDLVLMDVQMPRLDGLSATAIVRQQESHSGRHTPICAMTAHAMKGDRERCLQAGMDLFISKPIEAFTLQAILEQVAAGTIVPAAPQTEPAPVG